MAAATTLLGSNHNALRRSTFTVTKSTPGTTRVRFTINDTGRLLTTTKMVRSVLVDAYAQFLAAEAADLVTNGDAGIDTTNLKFKFESKYCEVTLKALTNIATSGTITVTAPFADV